MVQVSHASSVGDCRSCAPRRFGSCSHASRRSTRGPPTAQGHAACRYAGATAANHLNVANLQTACGCSIITRVATLPSLVCQVLDGVARDGQDPQPRAPVWRQMLDSMLVMYVAYWSINIGDLPPRHLAPHDRRKILCYWDITFLSKIRLGTPDSEFDMPSSIPLYVPPNRHASLSPSSYTTTPTNEETAGGKLTAAKSIHCSQDFVKVSDCLSAWEAWFLVQSQVCLFEPPPCLKKVHHFVALLILEAQSLNLGGGTDSDLPKADAKTDKHSTCYHPTL